MYRMTAVGALLLAILCVQAHGDEAVTEDVAATTDCPGVVRVCLGENEFFVLRETETCRQMTFRMDDGKGKLKNVGILLTAGKDVPLVIQNPEEYLKIGVWMDLNAACWNSFTVAPGIRVVIQNKGDGRMLYVQTTTNCQ